MLDKRLVQLIQAASALGNCDRSSFAGCPCQIPRSGSLGAALTASAAEHKGNWASCARQGLGFKHSLRTISYAAPLTASVLPKLAMRGLHSLPAAATSFCMLRCA